MYLIQFLPFETKEENQIEIANELCVLLIMHGINTLIDPSIKPRLRDNGGYGIVLISTINIIGNITHTAVSGVRE